MKREWETQNVPLLHPSQDNSTCEEEQSHGNSNARPSGVHPAVLSCSFVPCMLYKLVAGILFIHERSNGIHPSAVVILTF